MNTELEIRFSERKSESKIFYERKETTIMIWLSERNGQNKHTGIDN